MTTSSMRRHTPFGPTDPNFCLWGGDADVINCAKLFENRFGGSGAGRPWKMALPIESVHRPYNSAAVTHRLWFRKNENFHVSVAYGYTSNIQTMGSRLHYSIPICSFTVVNLWSVTIARWSLLYVAFCSGVAAASWRTRLCEGWEWK